MHSFQPLSVSTHQLLINEGRQGGTIPGHVRARPRLAILGLSSTTTRSTFFLGRESCTYPTIRLSKASRYVRMCLYTKETKVQIRRVTEEDVVGVKSKAAYECPIEPLYSRRALRLLRSSHDPRSSPSAAAGSTALSHGHCCYYCTCH